MKKQTMPSIDIPLFEANGEMSMVWYMFFKNLSDAVFNNTKSDDASEE